MTKQNCSCMTCWPVNVYLVAIIKSGIIMKDRIEGDIVSDFEMKNRFNKKFDSFVGFFFSDQNKIKKSIIKPPKMSTVYLVYALRFIVML